MKISCVIVTYNRVELLKENLAAIMSQTYKPDHIYVVNNHSTDNTAEYLTQFADIPNFTVCNLEKNVGGSGGFVYGIKRAIADGSDYVWIMDDDTIPHPDALEQLAKATTLSDNIGFVCSKVVWTDGSQHKMNGCGIRKPERKAVSDKYDGVYGVECYQSTFVSTMISAKAVFKVGLPYKEFFIWHDDIEYTDRISNAGFVCYFIEKSVVTHKTARNYKPHIQDTAKGDLWKFYYQARNTTFIASMKKPNKLVYYVSIINKYRRYIRKINQIKDKELRQKMKHEVKQGCLDGLKFRPKIEYIKMPDRQADGKK